MGSSQEFFGICSDAFSETAIELLLSLVQNGTLGGQMSVSFFDGAVPNGGSVTFHTLYF